MRNPERTTPTVVLLLPSMRISGGVQEALRLAKSLVQRGVLVKVVSLWKHDHASPSDGLAVEYLSINPPRRGMAPFALPLLAFRYVRYIAALRRSGTQQVTLMLTHYITFPFAWLTPWLQRFCFNQDVEWMFLPKGPLRSLLRMFLLSTSRRSRVITTNAFVSAKYSAEGVTPFAQASIWAAPEWHSSEPEGDRPFDLVMLLRHAQIKRLDLYLELLRLDRPTPLRIAVITPESDIPGQVVDLADQVLLRPTNDEIRALYLKTKLFVLLSDTEGFGLPPLEAMGSGCVPVCRDSGGVRCYLSGALARNVVPKEESMPEVMARIVALLGNATELAELSTSARRIFADGLATSRAQRESCMDQIASELLRGAQATREPGRSADLSQLGKERP